MFVKELGRENDAEEPIDPLGQIHSFSKRILYTIKQLGHAMYNATNTHWFTSTSKTRIVENMYIQFLSCNSFWDIIINVEWDKRIDIQNIPYR